MFATLPYRDGGGASNRASAEIWPLSRLKRTFWPTAATPSMAVLPTGKGWVPAGQLSASTGS